MWKICFVCALSCRSCTHFHYRSPSWLKLTRKASYFLTNSVNAFPMHITHMSVIHFPAMWGAVGSSCNAKDILNAIKLHDSEQYIAIKIRDTPPRVSGTRPKPFSQTAHKVNKRLGGWEMDRIIINLGNGILFVVIVDIPSYDMTRKLSTFILYFILLAWNNSKNAFQINSSLLRLSIATETVILTYWRPGKEICTYKKINKEKKIFERWMDDI